MPWYEASVVTGLEKLAGQEVREKLDVQANQLEVGRGRLFFNTDLPVQQVLQLRSIDNLRAVVYRNESEKNFPESKDELNEFCLRLIKAGDWNTAIDIWRTVFDYNRCSVHDILSQDDHLNKPTFRANCKRSGTHKFGGSPEATIEFGGCLNNHFKWPVNLKEFDLEVILNLLDKHVYVTVSLSRTSLGHNRNLINFGKGSIRSTICYGILKLADLREGMVVCDPLCGSSALLIEACISWPQCIYISSDRDLKALEKTLDNKSITLKHFNESSSSESNSQPRKPSNVDRNQQNLYNKLDIIQLDSTNLPYINDSIDRFVTDLPFGKRFSTKAFNYHLYPKLLLEFARCTRLNVGRAILLTKDIKNMIGCLNNPQIKKFWTKIGINSINVGGLFASVYVLKRTNVAFE